MWLIAVIIVGRWFFNLAKKNDKNPVPIVIIGVITYTISKAIIDVIFRIFLLDFYEALLLEWVAIPFALIAVWIVRSVIKSSWEPKKERKSKVHYDSRVEKSTTTASPTPTLDTSKGTSKVNLVKPTHSEPTQVPRQATGRYNKNER